MRLGIASSLGFEKDPKEWAEFVRSLGCRAMTFPLDSSADESLIDEFACAAKEYDIMIAEVGAWSNTLSPDPETKRAAIERCKAQLRLADRVGARCCANITGGKGERWDGAYKENYDPATFDEAVEVIREIIDDVQPTNTFYTIESMPYMIPWDPDQYLELMRAVDRERLAAHMDIFNWINDPRKFFLNREFIEDAFKKLSGNIRSVHIKNCRILPELTMMIDECGVAEGDIDLERYVELAECEDSEMPVLIEHLHSCDEYVKAWEYLTKRLGV